MRYILDQVNINPFQGLLKGTVPFQAEDTVEFTNGIKIKICELMNTKGISAVDLDSNNDYSCAIECFNSRFSFSNLSNRTITLMNQITNGILNTSADKEFILKKAEILKHNAQYKISFAKEIAMLDIQTRSLSYDIQRFTKKYDDKNFNNFLKLNDQNEVVFSNDFDSKRAVLMEKCKNTNLSILGELTTRLLFDQFEKLTALFDKYLKTKDKQRAVQEDMKIIQALIGNLGIHFSYDLQEKGTPFDTRASYLQIVNFLGELKKIKNIDIKFVKKRIEFLKLYAAMTVFLDHSDMASALLTNFAETPEITVMLKESHQYRDACIPLLGINLFELEFIARAFGKLKDSLQLFNKNTFDPIDSINSIEGYKILKEIDENYDCLLGQILPWPYAITKLDKLCDSAITTHLKIYPLMKDFTNLDTNRIHEEIQELGGSVEAFKKNWKEDYPVITAELERRYQDFVFIKMRQG